MTDRWRQQLVQAKAQRQRLKKRLRTAKADKVVLQAEIAQMDIRIAWLQMRVQRAKWERWR